MKQTIYLFLIILISSCTTKHENLSSQFEILDLPSVSSINSVSPSLSTYSTNEVMMSWTEKTMNGHRLLFTELENNHWTKPKEISSGSNWFVNWADFPSIIKLDKNTYAAHWLERREAGGYAYDTYISMSHDEGKTWNKKIITHDDGTDTEHGFVSLFNDNNQLGFVYLDGRKMLSNDHSDSYESGMTLRYGRISKDGILTKQLELDKLVCECCQTDVATTDKGVLAVYRNRSEDETRDIYITHSDNQQWSKGRPINQDGWQISGCPVNGPKIVTNNNEVMVAWFTVANEEPVIRFTKSKDYGKSFGSPVDIASGGNVLGHVDTAIDDNGTTWIIWQKKTQNSIELILSNVLNNNELGIQRIIYEGNDMPRFSNPQIAYSSKQLVIAWTKNSDDTTSVSTVRIPII